MAKKMKTMDGNFAAAHIAYAFTEVACDLSDHSVVYDGGICRRVDAAKGQKNIFGQTS